MKPLRVVVLGVRAALAVAGRLCELAADRFHDRDYPISSLDHPVVLHRFSLNDVLALKQLPAVERTADGCSPRGQRPVGDNGSASAPLPCRAGADPSNSLTILDVACLVSDEAARLVPEQIAEEIAANVAINLHTHILGNP